MVVRNLRERERERNRSVSRKVGDREDGVTRSYEFRPKPFNLGGPVTISYRSLPQANMYQGLKKRNNLRATFDKKELCKIRKGRPNLTDVTFDHFNGFGCFLLPPLKHFKNDPLMALEHS